MTAVLPFEPLVASYDAQAVFAFLRVQGYGLATHSPPPLPLHVANYLSTQPIYRLPLRVPVSSKSSFTFPFHTNNQHTPDPYYTP